MKTFHLLCVLPKRVKLISRSVESRFIDLEKERGLGGDGERERVRERDGGWFGHGGGTVVECWTAGQQVQPSILHLGHDS